MVSRLETRRLAARKDERTACKFVWFDAVRITLQMLDIMYLGDRGGLQETLGTRPGISTGQSSQISGMPVIYLGSKDR